MPNPLDTAGLQAICTATDLAAAKAFYCDTLGLSLEGEDDFGITFRAGSGFIRVGLVQEVVPPVGTALGWRVANVRDAARELAARGVEFERFPDMPQDDLGVWTSPGTTAGVAWFKDPAGNRLSISGQL